MNDNVSANDSYVRNNYGKEDLFEGKGGSNTLSDFLVLVVGNNEVLGNKDYENVGLKIHKEVINI